ncbi:hypothetical protein GGX14DRAFT_545520 [Mycena pura]|uniref:Peptidase S9 prolyl oligopeptidase catalytic domain-containing protein n=1 Tax=Mycena pura TaxID=153505 RepID=A0AAD6Y971_9AGAR|nr:hypothetical protein GGX14DRAFT_545520 [Mycena pura]
MRLFAITVAAMNSQSFLSGPHTWRVELPKFWDVLGPFPIHAREQQFLSPAFPINISEPIDFARPWPSAYADNGAVRWTKTQASPEGDLKVSFPNIRWSDLRATEGWAALQHHAVLHTNLTLYPPRGTDSSIAPRLLVQLIQGSYIAILDSELSSPPEWHAGNVYATDRTLPRAIELPTPPSAISPTTYHIFVSGDYEIRLFGDPKRSAPTQSIKLTIDVEAPTHSITLESTQNVICDFLDGYAFGDAIGLGVRSVAGWWTVTDVVLTTASRGFVVELLRPTVIAPSQTRIVPVRIIQTAQYSQSTIGLTLTLTSEQRNQRSDVSVELPIKQLPRWSLNNLSVISVSYFYAQEMPTVFSAFPPLLENLEHQEPQPPILCLHGAGVDITSQTFWIDSLPRQQHSWLITPSGRTPWGLDWHGASAKEAWGSVDALVAILDATPSWHPRKLAAGTPVVLMGHSNGGQGSWYLASRFPDRVLGVVPAAAYIKSQAYIPLLMSRSAHFIDPTARAILESSLTPDDNDLFMSNIVDMKVLAIHGGNDDNVPVWHSRELVSVLQTWNAEANVTFREDARQLHWYPSVLKNDQVQTFLDTVLQLSSTRRPRSKSFTLTVAIPAESGSLHGWKIERLTVPGRLGRLTVHTLSDNQLHVVTSNVDRFSVLGEMWDIESLYIDKSFVESLSRYRESCVITFERDGQRLWKACRPPFLSVVVLLTMKQRVDSTKTSTQASGRIQSFLSTMASFCLVVLDKTNNRDMSLALRIAHDLNAYHRLDAEIILGYESLKDCAGNILIIASIVSPVLAKMLENPQTPFRVENDRVVVKDLVLEEAGLGILFLHPHPRNAEGQLLFLLSTDTSGLERAGRLFPIRTGVAVPDWVITSSGTDTRGAGGVLGAGVYGNDWSLNEAMSWLY